MKKNILILVLQLIVVTYGYCQPPVVNFSSSRGNSCPGTAINFTDQSTNNPTSWSWVFQGGTPANSNAQNPAGIVYNNAGNYDVTLTATNASGSNMVVQTGMITVQNCQLSSGIYRVPYADGTDVNISRDHITHAPAPLRLDMSGTGGNGGPYTIVAAADGWIRALVDFHSGCCSGLSGCSDCNNYVWIQHTNGEWTKYTHFITGSVTANNFTLGQFICAGTPLGLEGDVGSSSGGGSNRAAITCDGNVALQNSIDSVNAVNIGLGNDSMRCAIHLHFEVGIPDDLSDPFDTLGGFLNGQNLIPVFCDIPGNIMVGGTSVTANPCDYGSCDDDLVLQNQDFNVGEIGVFQANNEITADNNFDVNAEGNVLMSAGERITLGPGFSANANSYFMARIGDCNKSPGAICNAGLKVAITESEITNLGDKIITLGLVTYPNPVSEFLNIVYMVGETSVVNLKVINIYGQEMMRLDENVVREKGVVHKVQMNTGLMPPGTYYCIFQSGKNMKVNRFVKIH